MSSRTHLRSPWSIRSPREIEEAARTASCRRPLLSPEGGTGTLSVLTSPVIEQVLEATAGRSRIEEPRTTFGLSCIYTEFTEIHNSSPHVAPAMSAPTFVLPLFSAFAGSPSCSGFVADALNDCSKSAMMSLMCSVPTDIRMRSWRRSQLHHNLQSHFAGY
jgi:hypothetical protein